MKGKVGTIESEGEILKQIDQQLKGLSPDVRKEAFQVLVQRHLSGAAPSAPGPAQTSKAERRKRTKKVEGTLAVVKDLNLKKDGKAPSLREFHSEKQPKGFAEHNALFVYYLCKKKEIDGVTPNHVYTCYKEVSARMPGAFYQSLLDTARRQGWIDTSDTNRIRTTTVGENFVEHDLPRKTIE